MGTGKGSHKGEQHSVRLALEGFDVATPDRWASLVKHVQDKFEYHYWQVDGLSEYYSVCEFVIRVGGESDDDDCDDSDDEKLPSDPDSDSENTLVAHDQSDFLTF